MSMFGRSSTAVVLGAGGRTGRAWLTGLLAGLADQGVTVLSATKDRTVIGTSSGAVVAARVAAGSSPAELYAECLAGPAADAGDGLGLPAKALAQLAWLGVRHRSGPAYRLAVGAFAKTAPEAVDHRPEVRRRLREADWPGWPLWITAVDVDSGAREVLSRQGTLADAVAASTAWPGRRAPVPIGDRAYMDGGTASVANVDLAAGFGRVLVFSPAEDGTAAAPGPRKQLDALAGSPQTLLVVPELASRREMGPNPMSAARTAATARAAYDQGTALAESVADFLTAGQAASRV